MNCKTCRWYRQTDNESGLGVCHRHPPTVVVVECETQTLWPAVGTGDFCGEYSPTAEESMRLIVVPKEQADAIKKAVKDSKDEAVLAWPNEQEIEDRKIVDRLREAVPDCLKCGKAAVSLQGDFPAFYCTHCGWFKAKDKP